MFSSCQIHLSWEKDTATAIVLEDQSSEEIEADRYNKHLLTGPKGNSEFWIPDTLNIARVEHWSRGETKLTVSRGTSHQVFCYTSQFKNRKLVRQSQIVQSVMQDYQYDLSHLLPVCSLLVQGPKITYNYCLSRRSGLLWWFTLNFVHFKFINTLN